MNLKKLLSCCAVLLLGCSVVFGYWNYDAPTPYYDVDFGTYAYRDYYDEPFSCANGDAYAACDDRLIAFSADAWIEDWSLQKWYASQAMYGNYGIANFGPIAEEYWRAGLCRVTGSELIAGRVQLLALAVVQSYSSGP